MPTKFIELFNPVNGIAFKYYLHFIVIYSALLIAGILIKFFRKQLVKKDLLKKVVFRRFSTSLIWIASLGFFFLLCRRGYVYFLSMEAFHIILLAWLIAATLYYAIRLKIGYKK